MSKLFSRKGFGLIEVMIAAVVLGFLIVGLTRLQMGNRETILRVRDRDAANFIAQHVLDSISAGGLKALEESCDPNDDSMIKDREYEYKFEGKAGQISKSFEVNVSCIENTKKEVDYSTNFQGNTDIVSRSLKIEVSWKHGNSDSPQSITMARVVK